MKKNNLNLSSQQIKFIGIFISVAAVICFVSLAGYNYFNYSQLLKELKQKQMQEAELKQQAQNLNELLRHYKEERERFEKVLFTQEDIATFLQELGEFAKESKVKIVDMKAQKFENVKPPEELKGTVKAKPDPAKKNKEQEAGPTLSSMPIKLSVEGSFVRIVGFLLSLEKYRQLLTVSNLELKRANYPLLNCSFTLRLYTLRQLEEKDKQ